MSYCEMMSPKGGQSRHEACGDRGTFTAMKPNARQHPDSGHPQIKSHAGPDLHAYQRAECELADAERRREKGRRVCERDSTSTKIRVEKGHLSVLEQADPRELSLQQGDLPIA